MKKLSARTLARGRGLDSARARRAEKSPKKVISGAVVWDLHQTYGFPWDLTQVIARENGSDIDKEGFEKLLEEERTRASSGNLGQATGIADSYMKLATKLPETKFLGYDGTVGSSKVLALLSKGVEVKSASGGEEVEVILTATPFYAESGGQVGDTGSMTGGKGRGPVLDVQKPAGGIHVHRVKLSEGTLTLGDSVELEVDVVRRNRIRANHSATHLLHKALKVVAGDAVNQKGSIVDSEYLRFDFSHFNQLTPGELERVEDLVNGWVRGRPRSANAHHVARRGEDRRSSGPLRREVRRQGACGDRAP